MKKVITTSLLAAFGLINAQAQTILDNNFDSVTVGTYNGQTGESFGTDAVLGNATGITFDSAVKATGGVGDSATFESNASIARAPAIRSRAVADTTTTTNFDFYFKFGPGQSSSDGFIGAGWSLAAGTDNANPFNSQANNRFLVGLGQTGTTTGVQLVAFGQFQTDSALTGGGGDTLTATLTSNNWYQVSFDLTFDGQNLGDWTIADLSVNDWGTDGLTGGSSIMSIASTTFTSTASLGGNINATTTDAFAYLAGNIDRGGDAFDNVNVSAIPEPSAFALLAGGLAALTVMRRRNRKA